MNCGLCALATLVVACSGGPGTEDAGLDAAPPDATSPDAGDPDAATPDAAIPDAAIPDAATPDAATPDAAMPDAATPDATPDDATPDGATADAAIPDAAIPDAAIPDAATPDAATPDAATPDAATPDATTADAGLFCATPPPQNFVGHYAGVATITVYWVDTSGGPSVCIEHRGTTTSAAILDVRRDPGYAMTLALPGHTPAAHELALDLPGVSHNYTHSLAWDAAGASLTTWDACFMGTYWEPNPASFTRNFSTGTAQLRTSCTASWLDPCSWPTNEQTDWTIDLTLTCVPGATTCIDGAIVTCDAAGVVTSSVACGAPCSPCRAPSPDVCGTPAAPLCTDLDTDRGNCGQCGHACDPGELCATGTCVTACAGGASCPTSSPTYCADILTDEDNCGGCGAVCPAGKSCIDGRCTCPSATPSACGTGASAYCTDLTQDESNCQNCGYACLPGKTCNNGSCVP